MFIEAGRVSNHNFSPSVFKIRHKVCGLRFKQSACFMLGIAKYLYLHELDQPGKRLSFELYLKILL